MKILLIGASSYVGGRLFADLSKQHSMLGTYFQHPKNADFLSLDITDQKAITEIVVQQKPDIIIHAANYASRKDSVNNETRFAKINWEATKILVDLSKQYHYKFIFISSQAAKFLDTMYGRCKHDSEEYIKKNCSEYLIIRPSVVYGMSPNLNGDKPFIKIVSTIREKLPQKVDSSWLFQPTYIGHISQVISQTIEKNIWNKTVNLFINTPVSQFSIARDIVRHFGLEVAAEDLGKSSTLVVDNAVDLANYDLSPNSYADLIEILVAEIKV